MPRRGLDTEQVVSAAEQLADDGLERVTFAALAAQLGVRPPSLYNHVGGRPALVRLITVRALNALADAIAAASAGRAGLDALRATAHAYRAYALAHPGSYEATLALPADADEELERAAGRLLSLIGSILGAWKLEGEDAIDAVRVLRSALHGFVTLERSGAFALGRDLDASFERLVLTLDAGLPVQVR